MGRRLRQQLALAAGWTGQAEADPLEFLALDGVTTERNPATPVAVPNLIERQLMATEERQHMGGWLSGSKAGAERRRWARALVGAQDVDVAAALGARSERNRGLVLDRLGRRLHRLRFVPDLHRMGDGPERQ